LKSPQEQYDEDMEAEAWEILVESIPQLNDEPLTAQVVFLDVGTPPIHKKLAVLFLRHRKAQNDYSFLKTDQLFGMTPAGYGSELDIDELPGIYIFLRLVNRDVLKVGQTGNLRTRIARGHMRYGNQPSESNVIVYCKGRWNWPHCVNDQEFTTLLFPMPTSCEEERCFIELGLSKLLLPVMK
jgi:hypothetical protein